MWTEGLKQIINHKDHYIIQRTHLLLQSLNSVHTSLNQTNLLNVCLLVHQI